MRCVRRADQPNEKSSTQMVVPRLETFSINCALVAPAGAVTLALIGTQPPVATDTVATVGVLIVTPPPRHCTWTFNENVSEVGGTSTKPPTVYVLPAVTVT